ncbi:hypothetical protein [Alistipes sp.]|uniref:hypothetical protein n=1 Tax=Alistipes sp. TaxID=1872444 RepID=UPI003AF0EDED
MTVHRTKVLKAEGISTRRELVERLAQEGLVERLVSNVCHRHHTAIPDLAQMVYEALLGYDERKLLRMYGQGALNFFLVRIIANLYFSKTSPYHRQIRKFQHASREYEE